MGLCLYICWDIVLDDVQGYSNSFSLEVGYSLTLVISFLPTLRQPITSKYYIKIWKFPLNKEQVDTFKQRCQLSMSPVSCNLLETVSCSLFKCFIRCRLLYQHFKTSMPTFKKLISPSHSHFSNNNALHNEMFCPICNCITKTCYWFQITVIRCTTDGAIIKNTDRAF